MKKALFILLCLSSKADVLAQKLTIHDLLRYYEMEVPDIRTDILRKNFKLIKKYSDGLDTNNSYTYFWTHGFNTATGDAPEWFTVSTFNEEKSKLVYETENRNNFLAFKRGLEQAGFSFLWDSRDESGTNTSYYENKGYTLIIQPRSDRWTIYLKKKS